MQDDAIYVKLQHLKNRENQCSQAHVPEKVPQNLGHSLFIRKSEVGCEALSSHFQRSLKTRLTFTAFVSSRMNEAKVKYLKNKKKEHTKRKKKWNPEEDKRVDRTESNKEDGRIMRANCGTANVLDDRIIHPASECSV